MFRYQVKKSVVLVVVITSLLASLHLNPPNAAAAAGTDSLIPGESLTAGQKLVSPNGRFELVMQTDGNLVQLFLGRPVWSTGTSGSNARLVLQPDGNLVVYRDATALFDTRTPGTGANLARLQDDGNFVLYSPGVARWSSSANLSVLPVGQLLKANQELLSPDRRFRLVMQPDGNLVVYGPTGAAWNSQTPGKGPAHAVLQSDGNFVIYGPAGYTYAANTRGSGADQLSMQSDGNVVIYAAGVAKWSNGRLLQSSDVFYLPFPPGASYQVTQSPGGITSHNDAYNRNAVDFGLPMNSRVAASKAGTVHFAGWVTTGGGNMVLIDHGGGRCTQYAHLNTVNVAKGQAVSAGKIVGTSGSSGAATGAHLHWNMVSCSTQKSLEVVNTLENGTNYPTGTRATSRNLPG